MHRVHAAARTSASAVTLPPEARMMLSMTSRVMFWPPRRMREIDASLIGGSHREPKSEAVIFDALRN